MPPYRAYPRSAPLSLPELPLFRPHEYAVAIFVAAGILVGAGMAMKNANFRPAAIPEMDKGAAEPVRVIPVLDLDSPLLKLGSKEKKFKLPDRWVKQVQQPVIERKAFASTKASKDVKDIPPEDVKMADAGTVAPPPDAAVVKEVDQEILEVPDAAAQPNAEGEGDPAGVKEGTETDPLKARAVDLYRARIAAWFSSAFRVSGSGLSQDELQKYRVPAVVTISPDRTVTSYSITPSGNGTFDAAANSALASRKGQQIPPPPENYPDIAQTNISLTFVCRPGRCD